MRFPRKLAVPMLAVAAACALGTSFASSHREAPFITTSPKVDGTDFYMFRSYEGVASDGTGGRSDYVTLIANYIPLQDPYGGPNYFTMDPNALYEIHIDNNGDAKEDITFQFRFNNTLSGGSGVHLSIGGKSVAIPLNIAGQVGAVNAATLNVRETYSVNVVRGDRRTGTVQSVTKVSDNSKVFDKPLDYVGTKTLGNSSAYANYAGLHIYDVKIPGCPANKDTGKVFVGQRQEGFAVNLGPIFDLVNAPLGVITDPANINAAAANSVQDKNVTSIALEVHRDCLAPSTEKVIGGWTTASLRQARLLSGNPRSGHQTTAEKVGGAWTQVSRLGHPLVNEVVIGLKDKNKFNASKPVNDLQFLDYVTNPTLPALLGLVLTGNAAALAPTNFPRLDLATVFLTGINGVNMPATVTPSEMLRLNTVTPPVPFASQNRLGIVGNVLAGGTDNAGFPNGRRPKDDVVDISLVAVLGGLCMANGAASANTYGFSSLRPGTTAAVALTSECNNTAAVVPAQGASLTVHDAVDQAVVPFLPGFPYLNTPNPGSTSN